MAPLNPVCKLSSLFWIALAVVFVKDANAAVLTAENKNLLCEPVAGNSYVNAEKFSSFVLAEAGIPQALVLEDGRNLTAAALDPSFPSDSLAPEASNQLRKWRARKFSVFGEAVSAPLVNASVQQSYRLVSPANLPQDYHINSSTAILCLENGSPARASVSTQPRLASRFLLRKNIEDLGVATALPLDQTIQEREENLKYANFATISYNRDYEKDASALVLEAAAGIRLGNYTPFIKVDLNSINGEGEDTKALSFGVLYDGLWQQFFKPANVHALLQAYSVIDFENDAQRVALRASFEPGFAIGKSFSFGAYSAPFNGPVWIRPSIAAIVEASHVVDAGSNAQYNEFEDYLAIGGRIGLRARVPEVPALKNFSFRMDYNILKPISGHEDELENVEMSINWTPSNSPYWGVSLNYEKGEDPLTYKNQESIQLELGLRF